MNSGGIGDTFRFKNGREELGPYPASTHVQIRASTSAVVTVLDRRDFCPLFRLLSRFGTRLSAETIVAAIDTCSAFQFPRSDLQNHRTPPPNMESSMAAADSVDHQPALDSAVMPAAAEAQTAAAGDQPASTAHTAITASAAATARFLSEYRRLLRVQFDRQAYRDAPVEGDAQNGPGMLILT